MTYMHMHTCMYVYKYTLMVTYMYTQTHRYTYPGPALSVPELPRQPLAVKGNFHAAVCWITLEL